MNENIIDVIIIGAGASGYGCAITLSSANSKFEGLKNKKYLLIDNNNSDIKKANFYNLSGVDYGIKGEYFLKKLSTQLNKLQHCQYILDTVTKISKQNNIYTIYTDTKTYKTNIIVLATGMHQFNIETTNIDIEVLPNNNIIKPNKIYLKNQNNIIEENLYVTGLASGIKTMFAIANGDGVKVACDILEKWTNKKIVPHD